MKIPAPVERKDTDPIYVVHRTTVNMAGEKNFDLAVEAGWYVHSGMAELWANSQRPERGVTYLVLPVFPIFPASALAHEQAIVVVESMGANRLHLPGCGTKIAARDKCEELRAEDYARYVEGVRQENVARVEQAVASLQAIRNVVAGSAFAPPQGHGGVQTVEPLGFSAWMADTKDNEFGIIVVPRAARYNG